MAMSLASLLTGGKQPDQHSFADESLGDQGNQRAGCHYAHHLGQCFTAIKSYVMVNSRTASLSTAL